MLAETLAQRDVKKSEDVYFKPQAMRLSKPHRPLVFAGLKYDDLVDLSGQLSNLSGPLDELIGRINNGQR
jgi:hypothetical protein